MKIACRHTLLPTNGFVEDMWPIIDLMVEGEISVVPRTHLLSMQHSVLTAVG
jgi:hypothetical protein